MRLQVKGKNVEVSEAIRAYAEEKLGRLERQLADPTRVELELAVEKNPSIADNHVAEATIWTKGPVLRARESSTRHAGVDRPADRQARAAGDALPREAAPADTPQRQRRRRREPSRADPPITLDEERRAADREDEAVRA